MVQTTGFLMHEFIVSPPENLFIEKVDPKVGDQKTLDS